MKIHLTKPTGVIMMAATILIVVAIAQAMPKQSFAQQNNATASQSLRQNTSLAVDLEQGNQSVILNQGNTTTLTLNSTLIPLQTTTVEIRTITKSVDSKLISELQNLTVTEGAIQQSPSIDLSNIQNQTLTIPTRQAISTIITRTDIPFNITTLQLNSTTGQNQTFLIPATTELIEQIFNITPPLQQYTSSNQTGSIASTQNNISATP
jgi:hypothetical protein